MTEVVRTREELFGALGSASKPALVPTMGALHEGHEALLRHAKPLGDALVASVFVNPTQFGQGEDFEDYPRTFDADLARCEAAGVDIVFHPEVATVYPHGLDGVTVQPGPLGRVLEGKSRPTHFQGVLTVVAKLLGLVRPAFAVFGEKDYQQLVLIRRMAAELCLETEVVGCPTVREDGGLAMSSRNVYLDPQQRTQALALSQALDAGVAAADRGAGAVLAAARSILDGAPGVDLDYLVLTDRDLGVPQAGQEARLLVAARVGKPRLLDNAGLTLGS